MIVQRLFSSAKPFTSPPFNKDNMRDTQVDWGYLDYLIIDTPPGTSDEHISMAQLLRHGGNPTAVIVTTPQEVAMADVRKVNQPYNIIYTLSSIQCH